MNQEINLKPKRPTPTFWGMAIILIGYCFWPSVSQAKFGTNGIVTTPIGSSVDDASSLILQPDGKLVAAGSTRNGSNYSFALVRYNSNGSLDTSFNSNGKVITAIASHDQANTLILQPDGKLVAAGFSVNGSGDGDFALVRYNSNGNLDTSFNSSGKVTTPIGSSDDLAYSLVLQSDGKLAAAGYSISAVQYCFALARYNSNGSLDTSFNSTGKVTTPIGSYDVAAGLVLQPDGKLVAAGIANTGQYCFTLARYTSNGSLDTSFNGSGIVVTSISTLTDVANSVLLQPDGKLVAAGSSSTATQPCFALARYTSNGSLDLSFNSTGTVTTTIGSITDMAHSVLLQPDGRLVAAGWSQNGSQYCFAMVRYNSDGSLDTSFNSSGKVVTPIGGSDNEANSMILQPDGKLVLAGYGSNGSQTCFALARYNHDGSLDTQNDPPLMLGVQPDHALAGQTVTLDIHGWNLDAVIGIQLRNASGTINGTNLSILNSTHLTAQFVLPAAPGVYDLYLANSGANRTFKAVFHVLDPVIGPAPWQMADLGKAGNPLAGPAGITIGDADGDGLEEIYVANSDTQLYKYTKNPDWSFVALPTDSATFQDVILADMDMDGHWEVIGADSSPQAIQYKWSGSAWNSNNMGSYGGPLAKGYLAGGGLAELYSLSGNNLEQSQWFNNNWANNPVEQGATQRLCSVVGNADNGPVNEIYAANADHSLYQYKYWGTYKFVSATVFSGSNDMTCLAIGDLDQNNAKELYGSNLDGNIYQFKWNGSSWANQAINTTSLVANKIVISDGDNDGAEELYAAGQDGHAYEFKLNGTNWQKTDLGNAGTPLIALAVGDGDNSHQFKLYAVGANSHLFQFWAQGILPTMTPTPNPSFTPTPSPTSTPAAAALDKKLRVFHSQINPGKGEQARIRWYQSSDASVTIMIYNLLGDKIATLAENQALAKDNFQEVVWDGKTSSGAMAGSGIYIVYLKSADYTDHAKIAVIK